jgi:hypothetical protein
MLEEQVRRFATSAIRAIAEARQFMAAAGLLRDAAAAAGAGPVGPDPLREIVRTNDPVLISAIEALFTGAHIPYLVLDQNMSVLEGSIGMLPRRILVDDDFEQEARGLLTDAGLGKELRPPKS